MGLLMRTMLGLVILTIACVQKVKLQLRHYWTKKKLEEFTINIKLSQTELKENRIDYPTCWTR